MLSIKDIIDINQKFHNGRMTNESSLSYAIELNKRSRNWLRSAACLTRAILIDHAFEDGNKRTAAAIIATYMEMNSIHFNPDKITQSIIRMLKENTTDIRRIERMIKNATEE